MSDRADGLTGSMRRWAILAVSIGLVMSVVNTAISNIALPAIAQDLHSSAAATIWVVNAFQLAVTVSLLPLSSMGDIFGYRRVYIGGLALFTLASLACAVAGSLETLVAARVLQGLGAAGVMSVNTALVRFIYPQAELGRGIGLVVFLVATSSAAGPSVAAAILAVADWPWLFMVNVPLGLLALALSIYALPPTERADERFDLISALLNAVMFGLLSLGLDAIGHSNSAGLVVGMLLVAALAGAGLVYRATSVSMPLLPLDLFKLPVFALSAATAVCSFAAQGITFVTLPFYLHDVIGRSQVATGLLMTPWPLTVAVVAPLIGRFGQRYSAGALASAGLITLAAGMVLLAFLPERPGTLDIVWRMMVCGAGFGLFQATNSKTLMTSAPRERSGAASGIISTARLFGQANGAALVAVIFSLSAGGGGSALSISTALLAGAGFALLAAVASALRVLHAPPQQPHAAD